MKLFLRNTPIERKLTILTVLTTGVALLLACASFLIYEQMRFRDSLIEELSTTAKMTGANGAAALSFDDADSAEQTLRSFHAHHHVIIAVIYRKDGSVLAQYQRADLPAPIQAPVVEHDTHRFTANTWQMIVGDFSHDYLEVFQDISLAGENIGTIYLRHDLSAVGERMNQYAMITLLVMAVAAIVAVLLMRRLQRVITGPVFHLAKVIKSVATERNYAIRAVKASTDELGNLTDGFNEMLKQIQDRDGALQEARQSLERRVQERTRELQEEILERRRTEDERDRFFTLSLDLLCIIGFDGYFKRVNPVCESILGFDPEELMSQPLLAYIHPDDRSEVEDVMQQLFEGNKVMNIEVRCRCRDGSYRWIAWSATPVPNENILYASGRDVSERKKAEAEMDRLNRDLMDFSRQAGMAEIATSVLHNVGNVLNSVNVSCDVITEKLRKSRIGSVAQIAELLRLHRADLPAFFATDGTAKKLPEFLTKLAQRMADDQAATLTEVGLLGANIEHIKEIVTVQQAYAKNPGGLRETLPLASLVEDALRMNAAALSRHHVHVERDYDDAPPVCMEKHSVLQILLNLVNNAKHAVSSNQSPEKRLRVRVAHHDDHVSVSLSDNGVGISPDNMTRIFSHGFTTKKDGHGFGLHSGVLAAKEMGGRLTVCSDGPGKGATFTLELPLNPKTTNRKQP